MRYVIWSTIPQPYEGHPLDRPGIAQGVCSKEHYDAGGLALLDGEPTQILEEFEADSEAEVLPFFTAWDDARHEKDHQCPICEKQGCETCNPLVEEHSLARRLGCRPYSELTPREKGEVAAFLVRFEIEYGKLEEFNPGDYWWKANGKDWESFNTKAVIADEPLLM